MPALPAPRPLPLSAYQRFGSPMPFAAASPHSTIIRHYHGHGHSTQHHLEGRGAVRGQVSVHGRNEVQDYAGVHESRGSAPREGGVTRVVDGQDHEGDQYGFGEGEYPHEALPMEMTEQMEGSGEGTMFLPHYEGYSYMLVPSHLEDDVNGLIFNAESLPVYEGPAERSVNQPPVNGPPIDLRDTQRTVQALSYQSASSNLSGTDSRVHPERSSANHHTEAPSHRSIRSAPVDDLYLRVRPPSVSQQAEAPPYQSPITATGGRGLRLRMDAMHTNQAVDAPLYESPISITSGDSDQQSEAPPYQSPITSIFETDNLPAYRVSSPVGTQASSMRPQADSPPTYSDAPPAPAPAIARPAPSTTITIPAPAPLFATAAQPVASVLAIPRAMPADNRPAGSILRVRDPIPGTTYSFHPTAERTAEERAGDAAFALALFTQNNSRPAQAIVAHNAPIDHLLTEEEVYGFDIEAYNARQEWRERQAEERRVRYQERQRLRESQAVGEVDEAAEEMYQLQEAIQMSLEEAERDGEWGWAADEEEEMDEELAQALEQSLRVAEAGRGYRHTGPPTYQPSAHPASFGSNQPRQNITEQPRSTQLRSTRFENTQFVQTLQIPQTFGQNAAWGNGPIRPTVRDMRSDSTDTNKPLPGLPSA